MEVVAARPRWRNGPRHRRRGAARRRPMTAMDETHRGRRAADELAARRDEILARYEYTLAEINSPMYTDEVARGECLGQAAEIHAQICARLRGEPRLPS